MGLNVEAEPAHFTKTMRRPAPAVAVAMSSDEALLERIRAQLCRFSQYRYYPLYRVGGRARGKSGALVVWATRSLCG
jgi:hypothetical protein